MSEKYEMGRGIAKTEDDESSNMGCFLLTGGPILIIFFALVFKLGFILPFLAIIISIFIGICLLPKRESNLSLSHCSNELAWRQGGGCFHNDLDLWNLRLDKVNKLIAFSLNNTVYCLPINNILNYDAVPKYAVKTQSNSSFTQGFADGILGGLTGVGTIRVIDRKYVQECIELKLIFTFKYKNISFEFNTSDVNKGAELLNYLIQEIGIK